MDAVCADQDVAALLRAISKTGSHTGFVLNKGDELSRERHRVRVLSLQEDLLQVCPVNADARRTQVLNQRPDPQIGQNTPVLRTELQPIQGYGQLQQWPAHAQFLQT